MAEEESQGTSLKEALQEAFDEAKVEPVETSEAKDEKDEQVEQTDKVEDKEVDPAGEEQGDETDTEEEVTEDVIAAPNEWSRKEKEQWDLIPDTIEVDGEDVPVKQLIHDRYKNMQSKFNKSNEESASLRKTVEQVNTRFDPIADKLKMGGFSDGFQYVDMLMATDRQISSDPVGTIKGLITQHHLTPEQLGFPQGSADDDDFDLYEDNKEVADLKTEIARLNNRFDTQDQQRENSKKDEANLTMERFESAVDGDGESLHPLFKEATDEMIVLINSGKAQGANLADKLEDAYNKSPTVKSSLLREEDPVETGKKVAKAKRKGRTVSGKTVKGGADPAKLSRKEHLAEVYKEAAGRS